MLRWISVLIACSSLFAGGCSTVGTFGSRGSTSAGHQSALADYRSLVLDCECNKFGSSNTRWIMSFPPSTADCRGDKFIPRIYSGLFWDISVLSRGDKYSVFALVDAPFSAVGDTLFLGATLIQQFAMGNICDGNSGKEEVHAQGCSDYRQNPPNPGGLEACAPDPSLQGTRGKML
jgi:uncharacterized protein YceK